MKITLNLRVYLALMALLGLTYGLWRVNLGVANTVIGLVIASAKASLVVVFFMELRAEKGPTRIAAAIGLLWLLILIALSLADFSSRSWLPLPGAWPQAAL